MDTRVAIIGCGAVTENAHLPALKKLGRTPSVLIDADLDRARALATAFGVERVATDVGAVLDHVDAVIVAAPNHLHARLSHQVLAAGKHVLVEKPMGQTHAECTSMVAAAHERGLVLMVGLRRRFVHASRWLRQMLADGALGEVSSVEIRDGVVFGWPVVSPAIWRKDLSGGGVLIDTGAHTLDQLTWWFGPLATFDYYDDAEGGVEADCLLGGVLESGVAATVELSRTRNLSGSAVVRGSRGVVEVGLDANWAEQRIPGRPRFPRFPQQRWNDVFTVELADWLAAVEDGSPPGAPGEDGAATVALIEACYAARQPLALPWMDAVSVGRSA